MRQLSQWLYQISRWQTVCLATVVYGAFLFQVMAPHALEMQGFAGKWGAPDGHLFYSPEKLYSELGAWGDPGRQSYIRFRLGLDPLWAITYTAFLVSITSVALRRAFSTDNPRRLLNLAALLPMCADLIENGFGVFLIGSYPIRFDGLAWLMAGTSFFKWTTLTISHLIMLYAIFAALRAVIRGGTNAPES